MRRSGALFALAAALLFGASTPAAKHLLAGVAPLRLASLLYLGAGLGLAALIPLLPASPGEEKLSFRRHRRWLFGIVVAGGIAGPILLMYGLKRSDAATASLLLNLEGPFTAILAWTLFHEGFERKIAAGGVLTVAGAAVLSWLGTPGAAQFTGPLLVAAACFAWAIDNNCTRRVAGASPARITALKGLVAGGINMLLAQAAGEPWPEPNRIAASLLVGWCGYGASIVLFILALRRLGAARTAAWFAIAPFSGALLSLAAGEGAWSTQLLIGGVLMACGAALLL